MTDAVSGRAAARKPCYNCGVTTKSLRQRIGDTGAADEDAWLSDGSPAMLGLVVGKDL